MRKITWVAAALLLFLLPSLVSCSGDGRPRPGNLGELLPLDREAGDWVRESEAREFKGDDLYIHINGGAEIYLEYGFRSVVIQDYRSPESAGISLEIFEMSGPESAYGMYSFKTTGRGEAVDLGDGGEIESYYLNFWKGPYLVTVTGFDEDVRTRKGLVAIAEAVEGKISVSGEKPLLAKALLAVGFEPGRIRYFKGFLGLASVYSFETARGLDFEAGARAETGDGNLLVVLSYGSAPAAERSFAELRDYVGASTRFKGSRTMAPDLAVAVDGKDRPLVLGTRGDAILLAVGTEPENARGLFDLVFEVLTEIRPPAP
jgi:hypothetical protein